VTSLTVTATQGGGSFNGILLSVRVLTGADAAASQAGATASGRANELAITTTQAGSWVAGGISDPSGATWSSPTAATSQVDQVQDTTNGCTYITIGSASATGTPGSATYGYASPVITDSSVAFTLAEILKAPGQSIAQDASTPGAASTDNATTVTTGSFSPPSGSLLVAQVASDSNDTSVTIDITDSAGLTWHQLVYDTGGAFMASGVWVADSPSSGGGATVPGVPATASSGAPAGTVTSGATITGAAATSSALAPAGSASAGATIPGPASGATSSAPSGSATAGVLIAAPVASATAVAPPGTISTAASVAGALALGVATAPAGSVSTAASVAGALAMGSATAPAGSVSAGVMIQGTLATAASSAPIGSTSAGNVLPGVTATASGAAPAGMITAGAAITGLTAASASIAPAGTVLTGVAIPGVTAQGLSSSPAGTVMAGALVAGVVAAAAAQAPAGSVTTSALPSSLMLVLGIL
jgi:hypothetical protein